MLSKSKYCAFSQCPKRLWLQTYRPELAEDNTALDARMETGNEVGDLAMELFPKIKDLPPEEQVVARKNLLEYCKLDTYAMVKVWEELVRVCR